MKYVFVSFNYSPIFTSPESWFNRTEGYLGILESLAIENTVINIKQIDFEGFRMYNGVYHRFVKFSNRKTYFPLKLNAYIKGLNPDIVFVQGLHHPLQVIQLRLALNRKIKIIAQHHAEKPFNGIKKVVQRLADDCINGYLFASHALGADWIKNGNIGSADKIHEVMEVSSIFHPVKKIIAQSKTGAYGDPVFLWVGRLNANKDPLNVIRGFLKFSKQNPGVRLYMVYHTDELLGEINEVLNAEHIHNIILVGKIPHNELLYWFNSADFVISGSHYEGAGTAVCEAMSCGCIPVVTSIPSFRMMTDNGNCGILYEPGNEEALLSALEQTKTINREEKSARSIAHYRSTLSFEAIAKRISKIGMSL